jgi:SAM-dependent MidA family methyltransferase
MRTCLLDPDQGYYASANSSRSDTVDHASRDVLGARGDFITSPEISQVFGELLAIFFIARWQSVSPSGTLRLVELGPGKGTLLADMIRTFSRFKAFFKELKVIHLVETSPGLMNLQHDALESALSAAGKRIIGADQESQDPDEVRLEWFPTAESVPLQPNAWSMVVAHEFFDALPTHIFERTNDGFREVLVDIQRATKGQSGITVLKPGDLMQKPKEESAKPSFRYVLSPGPTPWSVLLAARNSRFQGLQPGQRVEISPESWATARRVGELVSGRKARESVPDAEKDADKAQRERRESERTSITSKGGAGLIIDYGDEKAYGASFRAFKQHAIVDPLDQPGTADLTCNVDFAYLKNALATTDAKSLGPMFQSHFLHALGLQQRVDALKANASEEERKKEIESGASRLIDPTGMGAQYKVMGVSAEASQDGTAEDGTGNDIVKLYPFEL